MDGARTPDRDRVLVVAPTTADYALTRSILAQAGLECHCIDLSSVGVEMDAGAGALLLTDDVLASSDQRSLIETLNDQPAWSDIPVILLAASGVDSPAAAWSAAGIGNVIVLERPVRVTTLLSALKTAIRARRRQYQLRDQLNELNDTGASLRRQTQRLRLLWEAAEVLLAAEQPGATMRLLFDRVGLHFGIDAYVHYVADGRDRSAVRLESCAGIAESEAREITGLDERGSAIAALMSRQAMQARVLCPLTVGGRALGMLCFASRSKEQFDTEEADFLRTIAHYVAIATERSRLIRELRDTDRRKDEFLATLAHELRNPLAPIRNALYIMELTGAGEAAVSQARAMMERQLGHMVRLIDDLLDVSRITRGKLSLRKERVDLAAIVRNSLDTVRPLIDAAGHELTVSLPPEPIAIDADPVRIAQVLSNLLNNAAKYMDRGGRIVLAVQRGEADVSISVRDSGIGVPAESLPSIFELFTQVDRSLEKSQGGLGIGLTLVKSLVEMHGGRVSASSEGVGKGAEFTVQLPIAAERTSAHSHARNDADAASPLSCRVLVADDNGDAADSMGAMLRLLGNEVRTVRDGLAAVEEAEAFRPDVILLDIGMPRMNGYDAARRIRRERWGKNVTLVALTGWGQEDDKRRASEAGFDRHFTKPISPENIRELLAGLHDAGGAHESAAGDRRGSVSSG